MVSSVAGLWVKWIERLPNESVVPVQLVQFEVACLRLSCCVTVRGICEKLCLHRFDLHTEHESVNASGVEFYPLDDSARV